MTRTVLATITQKELLTSTVTRLALQFAEGEQPFYRAGQFVKVVFRHTGREERRSYSIITAPVTGQPISIAVKRIDNGLGSRYLCDIAQPGDTLEIAGAEGLFTLPNDLPGATTILLFAAGIGITPIFCLVTELLGNGHSGRIVVIYSGTTAREMALYEELQQLSATHNGQLAIHFYQSDHFQLERARLNKALVSALAVALLQGGEPILAYLCGPKAYERMVTYGLEEAGLPPEAIRKEQFTTSNSLPANRVPPDTSAHEVTVSIREQVYRITTGYPVSILEAALNAGIEIPYSCRTGVCGSCIATCTSGKVWMNHNEVLTGRDIAAGRVLCCQSFPQTDDVSLLLG
ncbi:MAG: iron-sulfur cluster-binding domain-containing protein [Chitinophagia bacterium]|nr:iron-sulfur cluster-binding domain-containing protein [Chitinophagia bacterium]